MVWKIRITLLLIYLVCSQNLFSQNNNDVIITFKNGKTLNSNIFSVKPWGLEIEDNLTLSYKVVNKLTVFNYSYVDSILIYVEDLSISNIDNRYIIDFTSAVIPKIEVKKDSFLSDKYFLFNLMSNKAENFEFTFNFMLRDFDILILQLAYSTGRYTSERTYGINAYSIGLGLSAILPFGILSPTIHYGFKAITETDGRFISPNPRIINKTEGVYTNLSLQNNFLFEGFIYSIGFRYYLKNIKLNDDETRFSFNLGLGIKL